MKCKYTTVEKIRKNVGLDWRHLEVKNLSLIDEDLRDILIPEYSEFFRDISPKSLMRTKLPKGNYKNYNFDGVELWGCIFDADSILPDDRDFFQKIRGKSVRVAVLPRIDLRKYNLEGVDFSGCKFADGTIFPDDEDFFKNMGELGIVSCVFPAGDYSHFNFDNVNITGCEFKDGAKLPTDTALFKKIAGKNLSFVKLPKGDYSMYDFQGVKFDFVEFHRESIMPKYEGFIKGIETGKQWGEAEWVYPDDVIRNIHNYDLDGVSIDLTEYKRYAEILTKCQIDVLRVKYGESNGIKLPKKVFGKEEKESKGFAF